MITKLDYWKRLEEEISMHGPDKIQILFVFYRILFVHWEPIFGLILILAKPLHAADSLCIELSINKDKEVFFHF